MEFSIGGELRELLVLFFETLPKEVCRQQDFDTHM